MVNGICTAVRGASCAYHYLFATCIPCRFHRRFTMFRIAISEDLLEFFGPVLAR